MGSKMAAARRVVQAVKPHTPLIRFPDRRDNPKPSVSEALRSAGIPSHSSVISQHSKGSKSPELLMHAAWRSRVIIVAAVCHQTKELSL
ncbi:PREDICTED: 28S ribosomal protein S36, mitochondrial isoform X2 [Chinchilla lanigera]|uniref:28S ribosomal protein S36, mitochondrial isoform X2 n=1 Tax=Chinchilla lanigera TaxID=34839 RepID=UPI00038F0455|nr:PREDICTED: 28S ribosomal protein S36, mitochondrial isoform X2 [Chinchilla lanigera]